MIQRGAYGPTNLLIQTPQTLTASWVDLGLLVDTRGFNHIAVWLNLAINSSQAVRLRCIARHSVDSSDDYLLPIAAVSAGAVSLDDEYFEFANNVDQKMIVSCDIDNVIPHCQFQITADNFGAPPAVITTAHYSAGY